ncbi:uncharacterized protein N0V89_003427 [Didymosphaeria variabile]|uniref:Uncharacterized protein n=1 Tax=Didymosphaeria variabile TaxID=1932322 RepID=A0A9W8XP96_9PLEO|nr:uncharacterized protein N0V89_003427 [Didymosphaeria variabile]KAJ4355411.1 hypothetical protein N0V89_003427 [Didymosphaeria variabile]
MTEEDIDGAIDTIQQAFADDPYNNWIYPDRSKIDLTRNRASSPSAAAGASATASSTSRAPPPPPPKSSAAQCGSRRTPFRPAILVPLPLLLDPLVRPDKNEPVLRPRRPFHAALLDLEGAAGGGAEGAVDEREGVLFL